MKNVWVRPFRPREKGADGQYHVSAEAKLFYQYLYAAREGNRFDPEKFAVDEHGDFKYVDLWTCFNSERIIGFIPVTKVYLIESLAFAPGLDKVTEARALQAMQHKLVFEAEKENITDAFYVTYDGTVPEFSSRYGWASVVVPMMNLHFADLEKEHGRTE